MAAGLIYLAILGMWVAYFLPKWINRHEDSTAKAGQRYKSAIALAGSLHGEIAGRASKSGQVAQRRRIFIAILALTAISLGAAAIGFLTWSICLIPLSALGVYTVNVRRQINGEARRRARLVALEQITKSSAELTPTKPVTFAPYERSIPESAPEHWIPLAERAFDADRPGVVVVPRENNRDLPATPATWVPTAVPRPTYASAPKAITPKRIIDLTTPGTWSAEQEILADLDVNSRNQLFDQELAEQAAQSQNRAIS